MQPRLPITLEIQLSETKKNVAFLKHPHLLPPFEYTIASATLGSGRNDLAANPEERGHPREFSNPPSARPYGVFCPRIYGIDRRSGEMVETAHHNVMRKEHIILGPTRGVVKEMGTDPCIHGEAVEDQNR